MTAMPRTARSPGPSGLIAAGPVYGGFVRDVQIVRASLREKAKRYSALGAPLVIAVRTPEPWQAEGNMVQVLLGSDSLQLTFDASGAPRDQRMIRRPDGFWSSAGLAWQECSLGMRSGVQPWRHPCLSCG
jgi:hypothetical protein